MIEWQQWRRVGELQLLVEVAGSGSREQCMACWVSLREAGCWLLWTAAQYSMQGMYQRRERAGGTVLLDLLQPWCAVPYRPIKTR